MIAHCNHRLPDTLTHYSHMMQGSHEARFLDLSSTSGTSPNTSCAASKCRWKRETEAMTSSKSQPEGLSKIVWGRA